MTRNKIEIAVDPPPGAGERPADAAVGERSRPAVDPKSIFAQLDARRKAAQAVIDLVLNGAARNVDVSSRILGDGMRGLDPDDDGN